MKRFLTLALVAGAALVSGPAFAQMAKPAPKPTATPVAHATAASHVMVAKTTITHTTGGAAAAPKGRMVMTKLANGKSVTYNCSLAGNASKKACK